MTPKARKTGKSVLMLLSFALALGAGALSAASTGAETKSVMKIAFGVPITNGYYGSYETGTGYAQARLCRGFANIMAGLGDDGYGRFSRISIGLRHIRVHAIKQGRSYNLKINKCTGSVTRRWES